MASPQAWTLLLVSMQFIATAKYIFVKQRKSFDTAASYCQNTYGTALASIHSNQSNEEASALCQSSCPSCTLHYQHGCWIGLNDKQNERHTSRLLWVWQDGSTYDWSKWRENEPSGGSSTDRDCVHIYPDDHPRADYHTKWADEKCSNTIYFLCNHPPTAKPTAAPTNQPSEAPTINPSQPPTNNPSQTPTNNPSNKPTISPSMNPSSQPSHDPSRNPTNHPSTNVPTLWIDIHNHAHTTTTNVSDSTFENSATIDAENDAHGKPTGNDVGPFVCGYICIAASISAVLLVVIIAICAVLIVLYRPLRKKKDVVNTSSGETAIAQVTTNETILAQHVNDNVKNVIQLTDTITHTHEAEKDRSHDNNGQSDSGSDRMYENTKGAPINTQGR